MELLTASSTASTNFFHAYEEYKSFLKVEEEYSEAKTAGEATLILLNRTIEEIDKSLDCFKEAKQLAMNASRLANLAYKQIIVASNVREL